MISVLMILAAFLACPAFAREKTDLLVMKNGDRISCQVKSLEAGVLKVDLDYVDGTISIDWLKVARMESKFLFLVQLEDGSIYSGKVISPEAIEGAPVKLEIRSQAEESVVVDKSSVVRVTETSDTFVRRLNGKITLGSSYSKGNSATQYNLGAELGYRQTRWGGTLSLNSNLSSNEGADTTTRNQLDLTTYRLLPRKNYFVFGTAGLLQSSVQEIERSTILSGGLGWYLKNTNQTRLTVEGGLGWQKTIYTNQARPTQDIGVAVVSSNLHVFAFKRTWLDVAGRVLPAVTEPGRLFARINASYYLKLFHKIDWNLSFYGNWDTRPPAQLQGSDYGSSTGLSYTFGYR